MANVASVPCQIVAVGTQGTEGYINIQPTEAGQHQYPSVQLVNVSNLLPASVAGLTVGQSCTLSITQP